MIGPVSLEFTAGHDYTIAATGQLADSTFGPLVIDETLAFEGDMQEAEGEMSEEMPLMARVLVLHGISDAPAVDVTHGRWHPADRRRGLQSICDPGSARWRLCPPGDGGR